MSYVLNDSQRQRVEAQYQQGLKDGNFHEMYQEFAYIMEQTTLSNGQKLVDSSPQYENARRWLEVATCANGGFGMHSDFIRHYTNIQGEIRAGRPFTEAEMQIGSNAVALNLYNDLHKNGWQYPTIDRIANLDAVAVGQTLFKNAGIPAQDCAVSTNCAWTGAIGFSALGSDQTGRLLASGNAKKADTLDDHLNVIYASYAFNDSARFLKGFTTSLQTISSFDEEGVFCGSSTQAKLTDWQHPNKSFYASSATQNSLAAPPFAQVAKLDEDVALDMLRSAYGGKIVKDTNNNIAHDDFKQNAHAFHSSLTLAQRNNTPVQLLQGTPEQWLQMANQDNYTGKVYRNALLNHSAYLVSLPEQVLDQRMGVAHPPRNAREQNALVNGAMNVAKELDMPTPQVVPLLKYQSELDTPSQQQTAYAAPETPIPARLQPIVNDLKTHLNDDLQQAGCTPAQITNACVAVASAVAILRINDKSIEMAYLDENKTISVYAGGIGREMPLNQAVNQPITESVAQMNQTLEQQQQQAMQQSMSRGGHSLV